MGKLLKFLGWVVGILLVLVLAVVVLVPMFVDPNDYKQEIVTEVDKATGRDLTINGEIGLSILPWLGLDLNGLSMSNAPGFDGKHFASVQRAKVRVRLLPLLFKRTLEVDTVEIKGLDLNLARSKTGRTNWDDLTGKEATQAAEPETHGEPGESGSHGFMGYSIGGVEIEDAHVVWDDQSTGEHYEIKGLNLETGALSPGKAVDVRLTLQLERRKPFLQADLDLSGLLDANPEQQRIALNRLLLELDVKGDGLPPDGVKAQLAADLLVDHAADLLEVNGLSLNSGELALRGNLRARGVSGNPVYEGELRLEEFSPRRWMKRFDIPVPDTADPKVLEKVGLSASINGTKDNLSLSKLALVLDESHLKGDLELSDLAQQPGYRFNLDLDQINLDRYLPPTPEQPEPQQQRPAAAQKEEPLFPVEMLRKLKLDGSLRIGKITAKHIHAEAVEVKVSAKNGQLKINQKVGRFYDGLINGAVALDVRGKTPQLKIEQKATRILAGPLLRDLTDTDKLEGSGDFSAALSATGQTVGQLKRSLDGTLDFSFKDGAVKGINLARVIREARAKLAGETLAVTQEEEKTDFSELSGSAVVKNGILTNQDLQAKSPYLRVDGSGKVNIVMENLDYTIRPVIVSTAKGQGGQGLDELKGVPIPIRFEGPWAKPDWKIDLAKVLEEKQKAKLKEKVDGKLKEKLPELKDKLPEGLKGLF